MPRRKRTPLLTRALKHLHIGLALIALMLLPVSGPATGGTGTILAEVAHAAQTARAQVVDGLDVLDAEFALSAPVFRDTDRGHAILILASVFSGILAFNFWLIRHLHGVYAPSRRARG
jgi:hypothetical protein